MATREMHDDSCDCNFHPYTGRRLRARTCSDCGTKLSDTDGCKCLTHDEGRCTWCGLDGDCTTPTSGPAEGDRVCVHCANGHQRVLWGVSNNGAHVQGPCNCEVA